MTKRTATVAFGEDSDLNLTVAGEDAVPPEFHYIQHGVPFVYYAWRLAVLVRWEIEERVGLESACFRRWWQTQTTLPKRTTTAVLRAWWGLVILKDEEWVSPPWGDE